MIVYNQVQASDLKRGDVIKIWTSGDPERYEVTEILERCIKLRPCFEVCRELCITAWVCREDQQ